MKYYSEITKKMYDTHEELDKAEEEYKKELIVYIVFSLATNSSSSGSLLASLFLYTIYTISYKVNG